MNAFVHHTSRVALATALLGAPTLGHAQDQITAGNPAADSAIVVTGYRSSNIASIETKRDSDRIVDSVSQDQAGLLPDLDVTQIAQRIPGLSVISTFGATSDRSSDDSEAIVLRGLDPNFNLVTLDGVPIASADENDRRTKTSIIPPSVIASVEAVKTLTPDLDAHGLSGQINLTTMSAFTAARGGPYLSARASVGLNNTRGDVSADQGPDLRADGAFATTFGSNGSFGLVLAGSYGRFYSTNVEDKPGVANDTYLFYVDGTNRTTDNVAASNGFPASRRNQIFAFEDRRERIAGLAKLEYSPDDDAYASIYYGRFEETEDEDRWEYLALGNSAVRPVNQTATSGTWQRGQIEYGFVSQPEKTTVDAVTGTFRKTFADVHQLSGAGSFSSARINVVRGMSKFIPTSNARGGFSYDLASGRPVLTFLDPAAANDLSTYRSNYIRERSSDIDQKVYHGRLDYSFNFDGDGLGLGAGVAFTRREQGFDHEYVEGDVFDTAGCTAAAVTACPLSTMDDFVLPAVVTAPGGGNPFYLIDDAAFRAEWHAQGTPLTADRSANSIQDDYELSEDNIAAYAQAIYRADDFFIRGGVRYDDTSVDLDLFSLDQSLPAGANAAARFVPLARKSTYAYWLPSILGRYDLAPDLLVRAAYGRTLGRPSFADYALAESVGVPENGQISIIRGNPDLKPRMADNFDLSLEYYFGGGNSMLSAAVFHKEVSNMIYTQTEVVTDFQYGGETLTAEISQPINASKAKISGIELAYRQDFGSILPAPFDGFILNANATFLEGEMRVQEPTGAQRVVDGWEKQPDFIGNVQLSYEKDRFAAHIAYNYVSEYLNNITESSRIYDIYRKPRGQVDMQVRYDLLDSVQARVEVQNLTNENVDSVRRFTGVGDLLAQDNQIGRRIWFGLQFRM